MIMLTFKEIGDSKNNGGDKIRIECASMYMVHGSMGHSGRDVRGTGRAVDERMVKSNHRSGMSQYMKDKPKWLILWVLADNDHG